MRQPLTARLLDGRGWLFLAVLAFVALAVPACNLLLPPSSPFYIPNYWVPLLGKYLCYALLAVAVDLIWGYAGILSLGHGAFFALGGYAMGMYLMRQIGTRGVYADPIRPDFMVFLNWPELPVYWYGFNWFAYAGLMVFLVPAVLAFVFGWFAFRSRVTGVYLSIITQALTYALMLGFFRNNFGFGGNNGLTDFKDILGFNVQAPTTRAVLFCLSALALALGFLLCQWLVKTKFGKVLVAIRDEESRVRFLGYRVENYKLAAFVLSSCLAGLAGALYVPQVGIINPSEFSPANSIEIVIWVAVGGRGTLVGAALGAVVVNYAKTFFTGGSIVTYWEFGVISAIALIGITIWMRQAILGALIGTAAAAAAWALPLLLAPFLSSAAGVLAGYGGPLSVAVLLAIVSLLNAGHPLAVGATFGALVFGFFITPYTTVALAPYWLFALGGLFILVTLLLPKGIVGTIFDWFGKEPANGTAASNGRAAESMLMPKAAE